MLTLVEVRNNQGALLGLPLLDTDSGFKIESIEGLDPVKATLVSSSFATLDGQQFHSAKREARNIKIRLGLEPDYVTDSVQDLRRRLYPFFNPKSPIGMTFHSSEGLVVNIDGVVESMEAPLFVKEPAVDVSIMCYNPDFVSPDVETFSAMATSAAVEELVTYEGSVETGLVLYLHVDRTLPEFTLYHRTPDGTLLQLDFVAPLISGDELTLSTVTGDKYARLLRAGVQSSVLYGILPQSKWIELSPGDNHIHVYTDGAPIPYDIAFVPKYGGL